MRISKDVRTVVNRDGAVLMDINGGLMLSLNPIGSLIWQQLTEGRPPEGIAISLANDFGISREQAVADVNEFVEQLEGQHLLYESEDSRSTLGPKPKGLFCNLFGRKSSRENEDRR